MIVHLPQCTKRTRQGPETTCADHRLSGRVITLQDCVDCPLADHGVPESSRPQPSAMASIGRMANGIVGTAKAHFGVGAASELAVADRYKICEPCPLNRFGKCLHADCGCFIGAKIRVASESCPDKKWESE